MNEFEKDAKFILKMWTFMISLNIGAMKLDDFCEFLDEEILNDNDRDIVLDLEFNSSKGINYVTREINIYLHTLNIFGIEEYQFLVEDFVIGIMKTRYDKKEIDIQKFGYMAYKLSLYYHPEPPMIYADDLYDIIPSEHRKVNFEIMKRAKYIE